MFKISEFSKLSQTPMKTLRYYDQIGLLKPAYIDPLNGYRYYSAEQLFPLNRILAYKDLGLTLEQIRQALDEQIPLAEVRGMLRLKQMEIRSLIEQENIRLARIEERLRLMEHEADNLGKHEVTLKSGKAQLVATLPIRTNLPFANLPFFFAELDRHLARYGLSEPGMLPHILLWRGACICTNNADEIFEVEVGCPLVERIPADGDLSIRELPATRMLASVMHQCQLQGICTGLVDLGSWIEQNGYTISSSQPCREVYYVQNDRQLYVSEAQIPVEKE
ncbi:MerR family transcriptional regulator [Ktedonosporobacter rubrisoli]|uniref:MerR family transcriptional regulator n=1 Tax=Ktedonosporobacter rubrisoli TaxID=2509675 RepID=A0A4P6JKK0_KTERU|nr:MerR family transcriptional regulator [Ktedonosporobacter rubrisoli]QBD75684.1 MerR family transcriptional regulator [Ktedonosporobacter rubrisoli]